MCIRDSYKTDRGYTERSLNSNEGWNVTSSLSFINMPILKYSNEIRSAVLIIHGEKAHSCYFSRDAYENMIKNNPYSDNKELLIIPDAVHTDLYDNKSVIPFDRIEDFLSLIHIFVEPEAALAEMNQKLYDAGLEKYMNAKQEALDQWARENGIQ